MSPTKVQSAGKVPAHPKAITLKIDPAVLDEVDEILVKLEKLPEFRAFPLSRQTILRLAIEHGLPVLRRKSQE